MHFDSFDQVRRADQATLRALLDTGDGPERVWGAWALAIELAGAVGPMLASRLGPEPDPGVRIHWVTILGGLGERQVLETLFRQDPDESVRAAAGEYLLRTSTVVEGPALARALIAPLRESSSAEVLSRLLRAVPTDWEPLPLEAVSGLVSHSSPTVRYAAVEYLTATYPASDIFATVLAPLLLNEETEPDCVVLLAEAALRAGADEALLAAASRVREARHDLFELVEGRQYPLESFGDAIDDRDPRIMLRLFRLVSAWDGETALCWLASASFPDHGPDSSVSYPDPLLAEQREARWSLADAARPALIEALERHEEVAGPTLATALRPLVWSLAVQLDELHAASPDEHQAWGVDRGSALATATREMHILTRILDGNLPDI